MKPRIEARLEIEVLVSMLKQDYSQKEMYLSVLKAAAGLGFVCPVRSSYANLQLSRSDRSTRIPRNFYLSISPRLVDSDHFLRQGDFQMIH